MAPFSYSTLCECREWLVMLADIGIFIVLIIEFNYDKIQDEKKHYKRKKKPRHLFEHLTIGESK